MGSHAHPGISIHALLAESDSLRSTLRVSCITFLSTLSLRRATYSRRCRCRAGIHFYPRSPCGERQRPRWLIDFIINISIHALLAESDRKCRPCEAQAQAFLSTLSLRRATQNFPKAAACVHISIHALLAESDPTSGTQRCWNWYFYPRSPCGERQDLSAFTLSDSSISIHALLAESDRPAPARRKSRTAFLSTLSLRRATELV